MPTESMYLLHQTIIFLTIRLFARQFVEQVKAQSKTASSLLA
ncbi:hypothetical protein HMPREF0185_02804 [Brevundimonas diminuta 470-4]|nr:hypothetical protein HMPREF0185_02804 [Brevundimonas diminuta 470-4]